MLSSLLERFGMFWDNLSLPTEIVASFTLFQEIWLAIPYAVRVAFTACFTFACVLAAVKMLF